MQRTRTSSSCSTILYAPNVHTGGGLVLLKSLLTDWPVGQKLRAILDERAIAKLSIPVNTLVTWIQSTVPSRFQAEILLVSLAHPGDTVLCFHGLPPIFQSAGHVVLFQQNRLLLDLMRLRDFAWRTGLRVAAERWLSRALRRHVDEYIVQTPTMARALANWHGGTPKITVLPFSQALAIKPKEQAKWDFIYVSDGLPHKNHARLLKAWELLASEGIRPSLTLTLGPRDQELAEKVSTLAECQGVKIHNSGHLGHNEVLLLYASARALIFPSLGESFGLPLIEARQTGLPILAPELDYVRDVCEPVQTFDPYSPTSIARAVRRFMQQTETLPLPFPAAAFWSTLGITADVTSAK
jgi:glycosyltransferase involved in cell wall biosynthesis